MIVNKKLYFMCMLKKKIILEGIDVCLYQLSEEQLLFL
jgi:hypothetical protein